SEEVCRWIGCATYSVKNLSNRKLIASSAAVNQTLSLCIPLLCSICICTLAPRLVVPSRGLVTSAGYGKCLRIDSTQLEFPMRGDERCLHVFLRDHERYIALRRALRDRDNVHVLPAQRSEGAAGNSGYPAHVLTDHSNHGNRQIKIDVLHLFVGQVLSELAAQRLDRALG